MNDLWIVFSVPFGLGSYDEEYPGNQVSIHGIFSSERTAHDYMDSIWEPTRDYMVEGPMEVK